MGIFGFEVEDGKVSARLETDIKRSNALPFGSRLPERKVSSQGFCAVWRFGMVDVGGRDQRVLGAGGFFSLGLGGGRARRDPVSDVDDHGQVVSTAMVVPSIVADTTDLEELTRRHPFEDQRSAASLDAALQLIPQNH